MDIRAVPLLEQKTLVNYLGWVLLPCGSPLTVCKPEAAIESVPEPEPAPGVEARCPVHPRAKSEPLPYRPVVNSSLTSPYPQIDAFPLVPSGCLDAPVQSRDLPPLMFPPDFLVLLILWFSPVPWIRRLIWCCPVPRLCLCR